MDKKTPTITVTPMVVTYTAQAISAPTVTTDSDGGRTYTYYKNGVPMQGAPVDAGSYTVVVETSETANYLAGSATGTITINRLSVRLVWFGLAQEYTGSVLSPSVYIGSSTQDQIGVNVSVAGESINVGTYACTATLTGAKADNYEIAPGYETNTLTITKIQIVAGLNVVAYDGTDKWPSNTGYVTYSGAGTAINAGTYQVTASLLDTQNTEWSDHTTADKPLTLTINAADISSCTVTGIDASYDFTGSAITPNPTVKFGGDTLVEDTDYTVSYSDNVETGTAYVIITGGGNFTGTTTVTFAIVQPMPTIFTLANPNSTAEFYEFSSSTAWSVQQAHTSYNASRRVAIGKIHSGKSVRELVTMFVESQWENILVKDKDSHVIAKENWSSTTVTTGMQLVLYDTNNKVLDRIYVVIYGDINQDGLINAADNTTLRNMIIGRINLTYEARIACDLNFDGDINTQDFAVLQAKIKGTSDYEAGWD